MLYNFPLPLFQKWQCVEDPTGKLRLYKCKSMASLYAPRMQALMAGGASHVQPPPASDSDSCNCDDVGFKTSFLKRKRLLTKKSEFLSRPIVLPVINTSDFFFTQKDTRVLYFEMSSR